MNIAKNKIIMYTNCRKVGIMQDKKYLNEVSYHKTRNKIVLIGALIMAVGLCIGGFLIFNGIFKPNSSKVETLQTKLENMRKELENSGIVYDSTAKYTDGDKYTLKIITNALDPSFDYCAFSEYKNNSITKSYCSAKNSVGEFASTGSIMLGVFICIATCMFAIPILISTKGRELMAYSTQQVMPVAKETMDEVAPTIGNTFKEITKGIKEGLKDEDKK